MGDVGPFTLHAAIGAGGTGAVWLGRGPDDAVVAVKVLARNVASSERHRRSFRREIAGVARLDHPAVVRLVDAGVVEHAGRLAAGTPWLAMELAQHTLADEPPEDWPALHRTLDQLLGGLAHAHANGLVHRDLKPANVLWTARGWTLADFGLAHVFADEASANVGGTPSYMAPEQWQKGPHLLGPWTDLYALGCTAWAMAAGIPPFEGTVTDLRVCHESRPPSGFAARFPVPAGFEDWLHCLLKKRPSDRFRSAPEAREALRYVAERPRSRLTAPTSSTFAFEHEAVADDQVRWTPPLPPTWRTTEEVRAAAGIGLFGLRTLPLVGREVAQDRLWELLRDVIEMGRAATVVVRGEPGVGASALASWLSTRAVELGLAESLRATHHAPPTERDGLGPMFAQHLRLLSLPAAATRQVVTARLPESGDDVFGLVCPDEGEVVPARARAAVAVAGLRELAEQGPLVVWLEDVERSPEAVELLRLVAGGPFPALVVATCGPTDDERLAVLPTLELPPLPNSAMRELLGVVLDLDGAVRTAVVAHAAGNPGRALAAVAGLVQRGLLGGSSAIDPATLDLGSQLDLLLQPLAPAVRTALELAALLGVDVETTEWEQLLGAPCPGLTAALESLEDARLVASTATGFRFTSEAVVQELLAGARRHGRYEELRLRTFWFLRARVDVLGDEGRQVAASAVTGRALALAATDEERTRVEARWLNLLRVEGRVEEGLRIAERALARPIGDPVDDAVLCGNTANLYYEAGQLALARSEWTRAVALHGALGRQRSVQLNRRNLAVLDRIQGRWDASERGLLGLVAEYEAQRDTVTAARTHGLLARLHLDAAMMTDGARAAAAAHHLALAAPLKDAADHRVAALHLRTDQATLLEEREGDRAAALELLGDAVRDLLDLGLVQSAANVAGQWALATARDGRPEEALAELDQYTEHARVRTAGLLTRLVLDTVVARILGAAGEWDEALTVALRTLPGLAEAELVCQVDLWLVAIRAHAARGDAAAAWAAVSAAQQVADRFGLTASSAELAAVTGLAAVSLGRHDAGRVALARAEALAAEAHVLPFGAAMRALTTLRAALQP
jgi:hypothetical protein